MTFVGRADPVRRLQAWFAGEGLGTPLSIVSLCGPGGIGKTFLLEHAIQTASLEGRGYLRLKLVGSAEPRSLGQVVCHDLLQSCAQLDPTGKDYFIETRKNLTALRRIDEQARSEVETAVGGNTGARQVILDVFRLGAGIQNALPLLKTYVDITKVKEEHVDLVLGLLEKAQAYKPEWRALGGILPDVLESGRRNRLRAGMGATLADGLVADLSALLAHWRAGDALKAMPQKVAKLDRLLLVIDDFESLSDLLNTFLGEQLVPLLARANFETLLVVLGRDRLSDTHPIWRQRHNAYIVDELRLDPLTREEGEAFIRSRGLSEVSIVTRILADTEGYPYLLAGEVEAELRGGSTALGLRGFYDRTTRWMTSTQKSWFLPLCFLDEINEETIAVVLPEEDPRLVLEWFKGEASVRSPTAKKWEVLPIIRSRMCAYLKLDSPKRHRDLGARAKIASGDLPSPPPS